MDGSSQLVYITEIFFLSFNLILKTFALDFPYWDGSLDLANYDQFVDLAKYDLRHKESQTTVVSGSGVAKIKCWTPITMIFDTRS